MIALAEKNLLNNRWILRGGFRYCRVSLQATGNTVIPRFANKTNMGAPHVTKRPHHVQWFESVSDE